MLEFRSSKIFLLSSTFNMMLIINFQNSPQWIQITLTRCISLISIAIKFQGGFAAKRFVIENQQQDGTFHHVAEFYPNDHGKLQISFFYLIFLQERYLSFLILSSLTLDTRFPSSDSSFDRSNSISTDIRR